MEKLDETFTVNYNVAVAINNYWMCWLFGSLSEIGMRIEWMCFLFRSYRFADAHGTCDTTRKILRFVSFCFFFLCLPLFNPRIHQLCENWFIFFLIFSNHRQNLNSDFTDSALGSSDKSPLPYGNFQLRDTTVQSILNHPRYGPK